MTYTLPFENEEQLRIDFNTIRAIINPESDYIQLEITQNDTLYHTVEAMYKKVLQMDGQYRLKSNAWTAPRINVSVIFN